MDIKATKLELIEQITRIQNERLLERLEAFLKQAQQEEKPERVTSFSKEESELLLKINAGLPEDLQYRYNELTAKSLDETLSEDEQKELSKLIPKVEAKSVERLKYLVELAKLWKISVDEVMNRLGITPPPVIHV